MNPPTRLYLLRHGEVESRHHRVFGGKIDMELSPLGHDQVKAATNYFSVPAACNVSLASQSGDANAPSYHQSLGFFCSGFQRS